MEKVASYALGCKVNQYESEAIAELFEEKGYEIVDVEDFADIYIINTCSVTNFGDKKSRQLIRKVKRQNPNAIVVAIGCYAQTAKDDVMKIEGVNLVLGTKGKSDVVRLVEEYTLENGVVSIVDDISRERFFEPLQVQKLKKRTRAYLKIQDGCSQFCTYCIIPYARGPIRSRQRDDVINEVKNLAKNGFKDVVLAGIHVASYGKDLKNIDLLGIINDVHNIEGIDRIRFSSIEPNIITKDFMEGLVQLPKVCHHFHLSLQSGCDKTLKAMNRKYNTEKYRQAVNTLRNYMPDVAITTDIIVGFPGESEEDFKQSYEFAQEMKFSKIHVFPYSPKKGTPAAQMKEQISNEIKSERVKILMSLSDKMSKDFIEGFIGKDVEVLFERKCEDGQYEGHTSNYIKVFADSKVDIINNIKLVNLKNSDNENAYGTVL